MTEITGTAAVHSEHTLRVPETVRGRITTRTQSTGARKRISSLNIALIMGKELRMIKTDKGKIEISGDIASMFADIGIISNTAKDILVEHGMTAEMAEEKIIDMVKKGFMSEEEIAKAIKDKITSLLGGANKND